MTPTSLVETARLILRAPRVEDATAFFAINVDPEAHRFNPAGPMTRAGAGEAFEAKLAHWRRHGHGSWSIATRSAPDTVIGFGGLTCRLFGDTERLNLGFRFAPSAWGHGYATELAQAALAVAWTRLHAEAVWATVRENHAASRRVIEKIGMTRRDRIADPREGVAASLWYAIESPGTAAEKP
jgi:RimJ/RimL family protein N-acetyltransferase